MPFRPKSMSQAEFRGIMSDIFLTFQKYFDQNQTVKVIFSESKTDVKKIIIKPTKIKNETKWQIERHIKDKVFHLNLTAKEIEEERLFLVGCLTGGLIA